MSEQTSRRWLALILIAYTLLGFTYALTTPPFEASDELWHYPMIRHLADGNPLPVQVFDPAEAGPWNQEASQPPLYYYMGAALTFWIDTSDMEQVRWLNPHVDTGVITADGNINLAIHPPDTNPWQGTLLAIRIVRLFSVLLGLVTVYLTFRIAVLVVDVDLTGFQNLSGLMPLGATAVTAFLPMFIFISGAVNNDNLIIPLVALTLLLLIWVVKEGPGPAYRLPWGKTAVLPTIYWLIIGVVIGLAALTKISGVGLLPLAWGTLIVVQWQQWQADPSSEQVLITPAVVGQWVWQATGRFLLLLIPVLLLAGWWYWRNIQLYGDWSGWNAFIAVLGERNQPASLAQLWGERWGFMLSYWGLFGGVNVPMPTWIYRLLNGVAILSFIGLLAHLARLIWRWPRNEINRKKRREKEKTLRSPRPLRFKLETFFHTAVSHIFHFTQHHFGLVVCLLWVLATVVGLIQWATTTWSSQGRLVFSALPAISTLMVLGLVGWLPPRPARFTLAGLGGFLFVIAALAPFLSIRPAYQPPLAQLPRHQPPAYEPLALQPPVYQPLFSQSVDYNFNDQIRLVGFAIELADEAGDFLPLTWDHLPLQPGQAIWIHLSWEVLAPMERNWSLFLHLNDPILQRPIAQRDMYLGRGLLATSFLQPGQRIVDRYYLEIPATTIAPTDLEVMVGLYDFYSGERLALTSGQDIVHLDSVPLEPIAGDYPNPLTVNFENRLRLLGYEVSPRLAQPGEMVTVTLYWEAIRPLSVDYTMFAQIVAEDTTRWASQDLGPQPATTSWQPGVVQTMTMELRLDEATPAALYPLIIGAYTMTDAGEFIRLQLVTEDGRLTDNFLPLTQIRVD